jgi:hypothetical protein
MQIEWPDNLSAWTLPPPTALAAGEMEPIRAFDSAEAAMAFLERQSVAAVPAAGRTGRVLPAKAAWAAEIARSRLCGRPRVASGD